VKELILSNSYYLHAVITALILFVAWIIKKIIVSNVNKYVDNVNTKHSYRKLTSYILWVISIFLIGIVWLHNINVGMIFSIVGAGLVISLSELIMNIASWILIMIRKPFEIGDRLEIGEIKGDVVDIGPNFVTMLELDGWVSDEQSTGRIVHIPNNLVLKSSSYNYTKGFNFIWDEIKITITFESDYQKAKKVCQKYLDNFHESWAKNLEKKIRRAQNTYAISYKNLTPIVYVKVVENGIRLNLRFLVEPHRRREAENMLYQQILDNFAKEKGITFAYNTMRVTGKLG